MGNANCGNAVPCMSSEISDSPNRNNKKIIKKGGIIKKGSSSSSTNVSLRSIDSLMADQREQAYSGKSARETEKLISGNLYQLSDDSGLPSHHLIETVGIASSNNSDSSSNTLPVSLPYRS